MLAAKFTKYIPLSEHIVSPKGVGCGRPTFKYMRVKVRHILDLLAHGWMVEQIVQDFDRPEINREAIDGAMKLASKALEQWALEVVMAAW
jgi:uncharacterized protein (DUF433 family)